MDLKIRKLITMHKAIHLRHDVDRLYVSRKGRRKLAVIKDCVDASMQGLDDYIKKSKEIQITADL